MEADEETEEPEDFSGLSDADLSEGFSEWLITWSSY